jgi:hypothetical protein
MRLKDVIDWPFYQNLQQHFEKSIQNLFIFCYVSRWLQHYDAQSGYISAHGYINIPQKTQKPIILGF